MQMTKRTGMTKYAIGSVEVLLMVQINTRKGKY